MVQIFAIPGLRPSEVPAWRCQSAQSAHFASGRPDPGPVPPDKGPQLSGRIASRPSQNVVQGSEPCVQAGEQSVPDPGQTSADFRLPGAPHMSPVSKNSVTPNTQNVVPEPPWASRSAPRRSSDAFCSLRASADVILLPPASFSGILTSFRSSWGLKNLANPL